MSKTIDFIFDFGSPNAYLAWKLLPDIAARQGAQVRLVPCLLGGIFKLTGNQAPMVAFGGIKGKMDYEMLETRRFIAAHGLTAFRFNPHFPVNTLLLMRGTPWVGRRLILTRRKPGPVLPNIVFNFFLSSFSFEASSAKR